MSSIQSLANFLKLPTLHEGAGSSVEDPPFTITDIGDLKVTVKYGTIQNFGGANSVIPTIGGVGLDILPGPQLTITGNGRAYIAMLIDDGSIISASILFTTGSVPSNTSTNAYLTLAIFSVSLGQLFFFQNFACSLYYYSCGTNHIFTGLP